MPQHDLVVANASGAAVRGDINDALAALGSTMKGPNAPPAPIAGMMWLDDDTPSASVWTLKLYDGADWISIATFDISTNTWAPAIARLALGAGSAGVPAYSFSGDTDSGIFSGGPNILAFAVGGAVKLLVDASSYVGVNTVTPARQFEVASANNHMRFSVPGDATAYYDFGRDNIDGFFFFNGAQPTFVGYKWQINGTERFRIPATGPVTVDNKALQIQLGTVQNTTSGVSRDFTSIPAGVREITIMLDGVSTNGTSRPLIQLGDSGGVEITGYNCVSDQGIEGSANSLANETAGFGIRLALANQTIFGAATLSLLDPATNTWAIQGLFCDTVNTRVARVYGTKSLSAELDRIRLTTVNGTDTFDAGKMNISWKF